MSDLRIFEERFLSREQAERYRDRYKKGRRARLDQREHRILKEILDPIGSVVVALDLPCGTGRFSALLGAYAKRVILTTTRAVRWFPYVGVFHLFERV